jgi:metal transporter CNNM
MTKWKTVLFGCVLFANGVGAERVEVDFDPISSTISYNGRTYVDADVQPAGESVIRRRTATYAFHVFCTVMCILFAALAAGLTMGLVSLEPFDMKILMEANEADCLTVEEQEELRREKAYAEKVFPLVSRHHLLLVTLLLMNSIANEALPLFLNEIVPPVMAVVISVTAVLIFGEILPSAIFTGPNQLAIGAALSPLVWFFIYCFWVISFPISILLDRVLGEEHKGRYNKAEFRALLNLHNEATEEENQQDVLEGSHIRIIDEETGRTISNFNGVRAELGVRQILNRSGVAKQELKIMTGALELHRLKVKDVMLPLDEVYMLSTEAKLDTETLSTIVLKGHSRIPVFEGHPHNIRGMLLVKRLIVLNPEDKRVVGSLPLLEPLVVGMDMTLLDLLYEFSLGKSHLAIITSDPSRVIHALRNHDSIPVNVHMAGIVTLEDVIERLIKHDIQDETDMISVRSFDSARKPSGGVDHGVHSDCASVDGSSPHFYGVAAIRLTPPLTYSAPPSAIRPVADDLASLGRLSLSRGNTPEKRNVITNGPDSLSTPLLPRDSMNV